MSAQDEAAPCGYLAMSHSYSRKLLCSAVPATNGMNNPGCCEIGQDLNFLASSNPKTDYCHDVISTPTPTPRLSAWASFVTVLVRFHAALVADMPLE
jgi:hypothetical protein